MPEDVASGLLFFMVKPYHAEPGESADALYIRRIIPHNMQDTEIGAAEGHERYGRITVVGHEIIFYRAVLVRHDAGDHKFGNCFTVVHELYDIAYLAAAGRCLER